MREIKFRTPFFDIVTDEFKCFKEWGCLEEKVFTSPSFVSNCYKREDQQFTGLKDKNGVEIYVGDIIDNFHNCPYLIEDLESFYVYIHNNYSWFNSTKVIGNIHQNKNLLK